MIIAAHMLAGGVAGELVHNSVLAFVLGVVLHFLLDAVPHFDNVMDDDEKWNYKQVIFTGADIVMTLFLFVLILKLPLDTSMLKMPLFWGAVGGILPDILDNVPFWSQRFRQSPWGQKIHRLHEIIQLKEVNPFWGLLTQLVIILASIQIFFMVK